LTVRGSGDSAAVPQAEQSKISVLANATLI